MRTNPPMLPADISQNPLGRYEVSEQIGHLLRKAYQRHLIIFGQSIGDPQLTAVQFAVLSASRKLGPSSMSDLGKAIAIDAATVRGVFERSRAREELVEGVTPAALRISDADHERSQRRRSRGLLVSAAQTERG
jgi:MarR family transcriptional regulator, lower aerobic nicotinate degradation pathway regulator